jgi:hypothetical protein
MCFDRATELRNRVPLEGRPWNRWLLAACWLNRADALTRLGGEPEVREAIRAHDLAIAHLQRLPLAEDARFRWRLAVAWLNRGQSLLALESEPDREAQALRSIDNCLALYRSAESMVRQEDRRTHAAAWCNRARVLHRLQALPEAQLSARQAIEQARREESDDRVMAVIAIQARHVLCQTLAEQLENPPADFAEADAWILEASDAAEESLATARRWEARGDAGFRPYLEQMFHFGARIYRAFQPHFLAEYLDEGHGSAVFTEAMRSAARESLAQAAAQIRGEGLARFTPDKLQRLLGTLEALNDAAGRLRL